MSGKSAREAESESPGELTDEQKIRRLPWFYGHNVCNSIFCQLTFFGPVFVLFLSELGLPKVQIGFLLSLLPFCGLLALFIAPASVIGAIAGRTMFKIAPTAWFKHVAHWL